MTIDPDPKLHDVQIVCTNMCRVLVEGVQFNYFDFVGVNNFSD